MHRKNDEVCLCSGLRGRIRNPRNCEHLEVPKFQAKVAFISELPNHPIVEMLCPLARCNVLVNDYYVKFRPVDQVERLLALVTGENFTVLWILSLSPIGFLGSLTRLMAYRLFRSEDRHFTEISREMGKLLTKLLLIRKDFGTTRLFEPSGGECCNFAGVL